MSDFKKTYQSFYSILVRLKANRPLHKVVNRLRFYSILVRLKGDNCNGHRVARTDQFLFHTGSIKRIHLPPVAITLKRFYSILVRLKVRTALPSDKRRAPRFYSILVRLKVSVAKITESSISFLFHTGSIKSSWVTPFGIDLIFSFYSILVRLKESVALFSVRHH